MDLKDGLNEITYEGIRFNVVKGYGDYKQGYVMSAPGTPAGTALQTIDKFDSSEMMVLSIVNLDYFEMSDKSVYGMHYGAEYSVGDGVHSQGLQVPAYNPQLLTFYQKKDGTCGWCRGNNAPKNDILFACSPYSIRYHQGREINEISTCFQNKELISTKQTGICMLPDGTWIQIVSIDNTIPQTVSNLMKSIGAYEGFIVDGGGSTQMIYIGKKIVYTGRALPNVFVLACFKADMKASVKDEDISVEENNASQVELDDALKKNRELLKENTDLKLKVSNLEMKISKAMEVLK